ncbi:MAG: peptidoglycan DD-metalloendopeptidase family protein [Ahrensia sp.]|nr:peptidoglycan DD-metalloendopeptidase family protein [Ahrensia sp.]
MCKFASAQESDASVIPPELRGNIEKSTQELQDIQQQRTITEARAAQLAAEVDKIRKDRASITAALIQSAKTEKKLAADIFQLTEDLKSLEAQQEDIRVNLWERRAVLSEVLAGLQRMGLNPPPALLVTPEDVLGSVRSAILLSAVVPHMRGETEILIADINELGQVTASIKTETAKLDSVRASQADEQARLTLLVTEKRKLEAETETQLASQNARIEELLAQAETLSGFITSLEKEAARLEAEAAAERAAEEQTRLDEERRQREAAEAARLAEQQARDEAERAKREADVEAQRAAEKALAAAEASRLQAEEQQRETQIAIDAARKRADQLATNLQNIGPKVSFSQRAGQLAKPVFGRTITAFGADDGLGASAQGDTIETSANAIVTAPADGKVLYAGPFRAYGNLIIVDAGEGFQLVLAGMETIGVSQGQFVLEGEPLGSMGRIRLASVTAAATRSDNPTLYVEFRKNSKPIDPAPWWERVDSGRT